MPYTRLVSLLSALLLCSSTVLSAAPTKREPDYYLKWNTDHTERQIRPAILVSKQELHQHRAYKVSYADNGYISSVCYFAFNQPSDRSAFGAHCAVPTINSDGVSLHFVDVNGNQIANSDGVFVVKYLGRVASNDAGMYAGAHEKRFYDANMEPVNDNSGTHRYSFERDKFHRRTSEVRWNKDGILVPEHNGFQQAKFAFDENDYALYRAGYTLDGSPMHGPGDYQRAVFTFDANGTFVDEEFRNMDGELVTFPRGGYARIEYHDIDIYGNWHTVKLLDTALKPLENSASLIKATYDHLHRRTEMTYWNAQAHPANNHRGVQKRIYDYTEHPERPKISQFAIDGTQVK